MDNDPIVIVKKIAQIIQDKKGINILVLDVREICSLTDFFIIAEGLADRHVEAIATNIIDEMKTYNLIPFHIEGKNEGAWLVIDYLNIIIHLFKPGLRDLYRLEELWKAGKLIAL